MSQPPPIPALDLRERRIRWPAILIMLGILMLSGVALTAYVVTRPGPGDSLPARYLSMIDLKMEYRWWDESAKSGNAIDDAFERVQARRFGPGSTQGTITNNSPYPIKAVRIKVWQEGSEVRPQIIDLFIRGHSSVLRPGETETCDPGREVPQFPRGARVFIDIESAQIAE